VPAVLYEFVTVGIQFFKSDSEAFSVAAVWKDSPAEAAGVLVGDHILSVNGHASRDLRSADICRPASRSSGNADRD
jgi:C-terminal processing protease CtpA/Prc